MKMNKELFTFDTLSDRTLDIIKANGRILLKKDRWYLSCWCNIASGPDNAAWGKRNVALEFFNLQWAITIAPLYNAKVVVVYPKKKE